MKKFKSLGILLLTAMIWGFAFAAQRMGADYVPVFTFNGVRFILGGMSLIPVIFFFEKKEADRELHTKKMKSTFLAGILAGLALFTASALQQKGIEITGSAGKTSFMTGLYTVIVPIFGIFLGKKTNINIWLGACLAVVGMFFLCVVGEDWRISWQINYGDIVLLLNAIFWAIHILIIDSFVERIYSLRFACIQFVFCAIINFCFARALESPKFEMLDKALIPILYCGLLSVGVAYTCQIIGQKSADPTYASIILSTEAMFGAIGGMVILNEKLSTPGYIGCVLIFSGVIISQLIFKKKQRKPFENTVSTKDISADDCR
ncbi:MAG: DMT family transporter [Clostridia bacterium]|nr:DMT family transporter [Clostridia bacterium]